MNNYKIKISKEGNISVTEGIKYQGRYGAEFTDYENIYFGNSYITMHAKDKTNVLIIPYNNIDIIVDETPIKTSDGCTMSPNVNAFGG